MDGKDQFTRAGRFLYLDWFNAYRMSLPAEDPAVLQRVRGRTRAGGCRHTRVVSVSEDDRWQVEDEILLLHMPWEKKVRNFRLHWLLPDWKWDMKIDGPGVFLRLDSPQGPMTLAVRASSTAGPADNLTCQGGGTAGGFRVAGSHPRLGLAHLRQQSPGVIPGGRIKIRK